jgi:hypothetical protein
VARTKEVTIGEVAYTLQSVTFSWYTNITDLYINPASGRKNTAKYADALIKGCVTSPAEVAKGGIKFFDEQEDLATPGELVKEIESFLGERNKPDRGASKSATE